LLYDLGLGDEVVGITKFCVHPEAWFRGKTRVGGTKQVHIDRVEALKPDLVLANKEENTLADVEALRKICPVWTSDISTIREALDMIRAVGALVGRAERAQVLAAEIGAGIESVRQVKRSGAGNESVVPLGSGSVGANESALQRSGSGAVNESILRGTTPGAGKKVAYLIWKNPYMAAGGDTYIHAMMEVLGWENVFAGKSRYPVVTEEELAAAGVEVVLLSSEPYPFKMKDIKELAQVLIKANVGSNKVDIRLVDGEMFSWYGSRMQHFPDYVRKMLHPAD
jgi:ABC-type Fe3+-hydroxamate transport system substrate-binding protein